MLFLFVGLQLANAQFEIPPKPEVSKQTSMYDFANILSSQEAKNLEQKLIRYSDSTSTQIVIITIESLKGEEPKMLAAEWGHKWGIGQKDEDNGIVILLSKSDRKIAIQNGYGIEYLLTDALTKRIIERDIIPFFKQGDFYGGLNRGADAIFEVLTGTYKNANPRQSRSSNGGRLPIIVVIIIILILISISSKGGRGGKRRHRGIDPLDAMIFGSKGRGGFGSFGGGSGGFGGFGGGFGGGGFGGGGASGSW